MAGFSQKIIVSNNQLDELVRQISDFEKTTKYQECELLLDLNTYAPARPQVMATITSFIHFLRNKASKDIIKGTLHLPDDKAVRDYMNRMGFFDINGLNIEYQNQRHNPNGRFIEVTSFNRENQDHIVNQLTECLQRFNVLPVMQRAMAFVFSELIDNVISHANSSIGGIISAQKFYDRLEISIVDRGIGIPHGISTSQDYRHLTYDQALEASVQEGVSTKLHDGNHQGFGLFATNEIVKLNQGQFQIISNNVKLETVNGDTNVIRLDSDWQGTIMYIVLKNQSDQEWEVIWDEVFRSRGHEEPWLRHLDDIF